MPSAAQVNSVLTSVNLARNNLKEIGTRAICEALKKNTTLTTLILGNRGSMSDNGGAAGAKHIADMLQVCACVAHPAPTRPSARAPRRADRACHHLSPCLYPQANNVVTSVDLSSNELCGLDDEGGGTYTAEGINALAEMLKVRTSPSHPAHSPSLSC